MIEISTNGGGSWTDIGGSATPPYGGAIFTGASNPLSGRSAYVAQSSFYPSLVTTNVNLGTAYAGQTVLVRFRLGADEAVSEHGWDIDNLTFNNLTSLPFFALVPETSPCSATAVDDGLPREMSFAVTSANPVADRARFRFALPLAAHVGLAVFDISGRKVASLASGDYSAGYHTVTWDAASRDRPTGVYFARMTANGRQLMRRVIVVR